MRASSCRKILRDSSRKDGLTERTFTLLLSIRRQNDTLKLQTRQRPFTSLSAEVGKSIGEWSETLGAVGVPHGPSVPQAGKRRV